MVPQIRANLKSKTTRKVKYDRAKPEIQIQASKELALKPATITLKSKIVVVMTYFTPDYAYVHRLAPVQQLLGHSNGPDLGLFVFLFL